MRFPSGQAIGVDVGATKIAAALVDGQGRVVAAEQAPTIPARGIAAVLDDVAALAQGLWSRAEGPVAGIGIGTPGQVDSRAGIVRNAVNLGWEEVALVAALKERLGGGSPAIWIQKDANAAALGEYVFGAARGVEDFVYLGLGSGLGGGVVAGGRLVTGADWNAAEVGHLVLDPAGRLCACGQRGCAETVVSGPGLLRLVHHYREVGAHPTSLPATATNKQILASAAGGDELALAALARVGEWLGRVMAACVALLNPRLFVIGGGLGVAAFRWLVPAARAELERRVLPNSIHSLLMKPSEVESSAVGAASLVWYFQEGGEAIG